MRLDLHRVIGGAFHDHVHEARHCHSPATCKPLVAEVADRPPFPDEVWITGSYWYREDPQWPGANAVKYLRADGGLTENARLREEFVALRSRVAEAIRLLDAAYHGR